MRNAVHGFRRVLGAFTTPMVMVADEARSLRSRADALGGGSRRAAHGAAMLVVWVLWGHSCLKSGNPLFFEFAHFEDRDECDNAAAEKIRDAQRRYPVQMHHERGVMQGDSRELFFCTRQGASPGRFVPECGGR